MSTKTFTVKGMTCGNCVKHVTQDVSRIPGVTAVEITLETGAMVISAEGEIDDAAVDQAVVHAGYELVS